MNISEMRKMNLSTEWDDLWTIAKAEKELSGFHFNGTGWYPNKNNGGILLVQETDYVELEEIVSGNMIHKDHAINMSSTPVFRFSVWNDYDIRDVMNALLDLPVHS